LVIVAIKFCLTPEQRVETENFIRKQQEEADEIMKKNK
jgi:hypothetical protein